MPSEKLLLVTGFEPFGKDTENSSQKVLELLPDQIGNYHLRKELLPVSFKRAPKKICSLIETLHPCAVLCMGQATGRTCPTLEKAALNYEQAAIDDNDGNRPQGAAVIMEEDAPDGLFSTLPLEKMLEFCHQQQIPASLSLTAGSYVCNCVLYAALYCTREMNPLVPVGFLHLPALNTQALIQNSMPFMSARMMVQAASSMLEALCQHLDRIQL